ncbi:MAG: T9SS type A sorting domain-containing protein [Muribaculaceae bacterium]|nr:T9SS type A sorting domain-containing protein [Muribaculaceae bacterium]
MRKTFILSLLLAVISNLAIAQTYINLIDDGSSSICMIPGALTKDGEAVLYLHDEDKATCSILNEDFKVTDVFSLKHSDNLIEDIVIVMGEFGSFDKDYYFAEEYNFLVKDIFAPGYTYMCYADGGKGIDIYNSDNKKVSSIDFPKGYKSYDIDASFLILGKKKYFVISNLDKEGSDDSWATAFYRIDDNGSNVALVSVAPSAKVSPRSPRKGETVSVTIDDEFAGKNCMVQVVSASGQKVLDAKIPAGQTRLDINTSGLSKGVYAVSVSANGISKEATKIIIR